MSGLQGLAARREQIAGKRLVVGFDGFVDTVARPVLRTASAHAPTAYFETIRQFGEFLIGKAEKSCSVELAIETRHAGGNLAFLSRGAGSLGLDVSCIGMLGEGAVEAPFRALPCTLYPFAPSGQSTCLEFRDGKVMLAADCALSGDAWELVQRATAGKAPALFAEADLIALVNWSELSFAHGLWQRTFDEALAAAACDKSRFAFFDLCDISRKSEREIEAVLGLIGAFASKRTAILSLNENEAHVAAAAVLGGGTDIAVIAEALRAQFGIDEIIVHTIRESLLCSQRGQTRRATDFVEHPKLSTGAGDHFNGASCFGAVMGLSDDERLDFAGRVATFYIKNAQSPTLADVL